MAGDTLTTFDKALYEFYLPPLREMMNLKASPTLAQLSSNTKDVVGRRAIIKLRTQINGGFGNRAEGEVLPTGEDAGFTEIYTGLKYSYGSLRLNEQVIHASASTSGAVVSAMDDAVDQIKKNLMRDVSRQVWGNSEGTIAQCGTTSSANVVVLDSGTGANIVRKLRKGDRIDIGTTSNPVSVASNRKITYIDRSSKTITIDGAAVSTSSSNYVFRAGTRKAGAATSELTGLQAIVDDTSTLFGLSPATEPDWASYVDDNSGTPRSFTESLLEVAIDEVAINSDSDGIPNLAVTSRAAMRAFAANLKSLRRYNDTIELNGGYQGLKVSTPAGSVSLTADDWAPEDECYLLNTSELPVHMQQDWTFWDPEGSAFVRATDGTHAITATMYKFHELTTGMRNAHGKIVDLSV